MGTGLAVLAAGGLFLRQAFAAPEEAPPAPTPVPPAPPAPPIPEAEARDLQVRYELAEEVE